jgi:hypothetical protein
VYHKKLRSLGIGCVAKIMSAKVKVNFGTDDVVSCSPSSLSEIDTSSCKTISFHSFRSRILEENSTLNNCIVGNELKEFVGIGWITIRVATEDDLKQYPRVIQ